MSSTFVPLFICLILVLNRTDALVFSTTKLLEELLQPWLSMSLPSEHDHVNLLPEVKQQTVVSYNGLNYVMVKNVSLSFVEAERYCANEFSNPMHLASVRSEHEWHTLANVFGTPYPSEVWLGGTVRRTNSHIFILHWLDGSVFAYQRFPTAERYRWMSNWRVNSRACITGNLQSNGQGNWSAELTPCTEARPFICKERVKRSQPTAVLPPSYGMNNLWRSLYFRPQYGHLDVSQYRDNVNTQNETTQEANTETTTPLPLVQTTTGKQDENTQVPQNEQAKTAANNEVTGDAAHGEKDIRVAVNTSETDVIAEKSGANNTMETKILTTQTEFPEPKLNDAILSSPLPKFTIYSTAPRDSEAPTTPPHQEALLHEETAEQVNSPKTLWDLTYPAEPKPLTQANDD